MLAELDLLAGDVEHVERRIMGSLAVYTEVESNRDRAECLVVLAGLAVARGSFEDAARLFGAAEALRGDSPVNRFERPVIDRFEPDLEAALPERRTYEAPGRGSTTRYARSYRETLSWRAPGSKVALGTNERRMR